MDRMKDVGVDEMGCYHLFHPFLHQKNQKIHSECRFLCQFLCQIVGWRVL